MFQSLRNYVYDRRRTLSKVAGLIGGVYLVSRYVLQRLEEVRDKIKSEDLARDGLQRRFKQTKEDISYTILAYLPTLGHQVLEEMDVEAITHELQSRSRAVKASAELPPLSESSIVSSLELLQESDARSDVGSLSLSSMSGQEEPISVTSPTLDNSDSSWVDGLSNPSSQPSNSQQPSQVSSPQNHPQELSNSLLSDSITTTSSVLDSSVASDLHSGSSNNSNRSKAELWQEVKILTFTRTLTIMYTITLLTLLTCTQLTILGRSKYISSILQQERDERMHEKLAYGTSIMSLLFGGFSNLFDMQDMGTDEESTITDDVESKYLTLSWWLLHVGWKDVSQRVQRGVEEVFESVSLKNKLGIMDLHRLVSDVRRRIELEVTFEGTERRTTFLSSIFPPTSETMQHILIQGGIAPSFATSYDPTFSNLLDDTRSQLESADFAQVLERCLDRATSVLFDSLEKNIFDETVSIDDLEAEPRIRLASLLPGLARWSHLALNGLPNELVDNLMAVKEVSGLCAIIFSGFEDKYRNV